MSGDDRSPTAGRRAGLAASAALGGVALALRLAHLASLRALPTFESFVMDEAYHDLWARRIAGGDWIGSEIFFRAPLYPYLLGAVYAVAGAGGLAPRLLQCLIGSVSVVLLHRIGLRVAGRTAAAIAALAMALCWSLIHYDNELLITVLEVFFSLAALLATLRAAEAPRPAGRPALAGVLLGLAAVARPNWLVLAPGAAWWLLRGRGGRAAALAFLGGLAIPILPVTARNLAVGGDLVLISSQGGVNFYIGNNPLSDGTTAVVPGTRPTWQGGYEDAIAIAQQESGGRLRPSGVSRYWFRQGLAFWADSPMDAIALTARKTLLLLGGIEISNNKDLGFFRRLSPVLSLPLPSAFLMAPLGAAGWAIAWARRRDARRRLGLPLLFVIPYALSIIVFFVNSRFRAPILPFLALGTGLLVEEILRDARARRWRRLAGVTLSAAALAVALDINYFGYREDPGQGHLLLALAWEQSGATGEALRELDRAIESDGPYLYEALHRKGDVLLSLGRSDEALAPLRRSVELRPGNADAVASLLRAAARARRYPEHRRLAADLAAGSPAAASIHFTIGSMDQALGDQEGAMAQYTLALQADGRHLGARVNRALLLRSMGRLDASLRDLTEAERAHPESPVVHLNLARHHLFMGDRALALRHVAMAERYGGSVDPELRRALDVR